MRTNMLTPTILLLFAAFVLIGMPDVFGQQQANTERHSRLDTLLKQRRDMLTRAVELRMQQYVEGRCSFEEVGMAQQELIEAELESVRTQGARIAALEKQLKVAKSAVKLAEKKVQIGVASMEDTFWARAALMSIEIRLLREQEGVVSVDHQTGLRFAQDGDDLVVTMMIEITDAPHTLWTRAGLVWDTDPQLEGPERPSRLSWVELSYEVFQCRDDPMLMHMRHRKKDVQVEWRIANHQKADVPYRTVRQFDPSAAELKRLAPTLVRIAEETETRKQDPKLAVP